MTHPSPKRNMVPKAVLMRSGLVSLTTARPVNTAQPKTIVNSARPMTNDQGVIDSGCSRHMTGNMSYLTDFEEIDGGYVAFGGNPKGGKITGRGTIKTGKLDFENVYFVPRKNNMYSVDLKNIVPKGGLTCLFAKATSDESKLWHRGLGHINFKTMNKLVKGNLVRGLPSKLFENDQTCVACQKGKQHRASCGDPSNKNDSVNNTNNINTASDGNSTNNVNTVSSTVNTTGIEVNDVSSNTSIELVNDPNMLELEDIVYSDDYKDVGAKADMNNLNTFMPVSPILTTRIHKDHPVDIKIIRDLNSARQTRRMTKNLKEHGLFSSIQQRTNHKDFQNCLFSCFLSQEEPKKHCTQPGMNPF
ncbi:putative ribonuclease H-like domain-containing protein [Tanacetum coccineum]